jgi:ubiquinone/menaquinone biosynthesis C-methylase UbiE
VCILFDLITGLSLLNDHGRGRLLADAAELTADDRVLDIGCGTGNGLVAATARGATAIGLDPSPTMLWFAARRIERRCAVLLPAAVDAIPLPGDSVSVAWASGSLHHWPDVTAGLAEVRRVLAPGGRLLVLERETSGHGVIGSHGMSPARAGHLEQALADAGFRDVRGESVTTDGHAFLLVRASVDEEARHRGSVGLA